MKHIKYSLQDWIEAKRKTKYKTMLNGIKRGLKRHKTPNARKLLTAIQEKLN